MKMYVIGKTFEGAENEYAWQTLSSSIAGCINTFEELVACETFEPDWSVDPSDFLLGRFGVYEIGGFQRVVVSTKVLKDEADRMTEKKIAGSLLRSPGVSLVEHD